VVRRILEILLHALQKKSQGNGIKVFDFEPPARGQGITLVSRDNSTNFSKNVPISVFLNAIPNLGNKKHFQGSNEPSQRLVPYLASMC
jgi:hypothetical protein